MSVKVSVNTEHFKNLFLSLKENLLKNSLSQDAQNFLEVNDKIGDDADHAEHENSARILGKLKGRETFFLKKINTGLLKIKEGTFGICEECGSPIGEARLFARPTACLCIHCKEEEERELNQIPYNRKSHTLGKTFAS